MTPQNGIVDIIRTKLVSDYFGKANAKPRRFLLSYCRNFVPKMSDRRMRMIYKKIFKLGWCNKGIYVIDQIPEVEKMIETETRRKEAIEENILMLKRHREFLKQRDRGQLNLFGGSG